MGDGDSAPVRVKMLRARGSNGKGKEAGLRLPKYLSRAGVASRRGAEILIAEGRVVVNGTVVTEPGLRVDPERDQVRVDGVPVRIPPPRWVLFHKPAGCLTTLRDTHSRPTVYDLLPEELRALRYVGRLDQDTEGLLLFTNQGELAQELLLPRTGVEREYRVRVRGRPSPAVLRRLERGVRLEDGWARAERVRVLEGGGDRQTDLALVLKEGRKREVRRLCEAVGNAVQKLQRVRFGPIDLGSLPPGRWRDLEDEEIRALEALVRPDT
jgi:pseudouridine synthase